MTDTMIQPDPAETPEQVRARLDRLRAEADQRQAEREAASRPAAPVGSDAAGMPSRARQNVVAESKPAVTDADLRMISSLASMVTPGTELEDDEVSALRVIAAKALDPADRIVVSRLLAPTRAAEQAAYEAAAPEREAAAKAGAAALTRGKYLARVHRLMQPPSAGGEGLYRSKAEEQARREVYGK